MCFVATTEIEGVPASSKGQEHSTSAQANHACSTGHPVDWNKAQIFDGCSHTSKQCLLESLYPQGGSGFTYTLFLWMNLTFGIHWLHQSNGRTCKNHVHDGNE